MVRPSPNKFTDIVQYQEKSEKSDEDGKESARFGTGLVRRGEFWERVEAFDGLRGESVKLVEQRLVFAVHGSDEMVVVVRRVVKSCAL